MRAIFPIPALNAAGLRWRCRMFCCPRGGQRYSRRPSLEGLCANCPSVALAGNSRAGDRWGATFWEASVLVSPRPPVHNSSTDEDSEILPVKILPLRPTISLARSPRHAATRTMVWNGSAVATRGGGSRPCQHARGMQRPDRLLSRTIPHHGSGPAACLGLRAVKSWVSSGRILTGRIHCPHQSRSCEREVGRYQN